MEQVELHMEVEVVVVQQVGRGGRGQDRQVAADCGKTMDSDAKCGFTVGKA